MKKLKFFLGTVISCLTIFAGSSFACTCGKLTVTEQFKNADVVFVGTVVSKRRSDAVGENGVEVLLKVDRVWKGMIYDRTFVYTGPTEDLYPFLNLCAPKLRVKEKYIVFAFGEDKLSTDICSGTGGFWYPQNIFKELGKGRAPLKSKPSRG